MTALSTEQTTETTAGGDRRHVQRHRALMGARILFHGGYCSMGCLILNISDEGALLQPDDIFSCPKSFTLKPRIDSPRECEMIWRKGEKIGVHFV
ncbi:MAG TPA: hypothetical protein VNV38_06375 [Stellaceae bacterium]|nr:hypothetical protein [Stellaceae bacterium]